MKGFSVCEGKRGFFILKGFAIFQMEYEWILRKGLWPSTDTYKTSFTKLLLASAKGQRALIYFLKGSEEMSEDLMNHEGDSLFFLYFLKSYFVSDISLFCFNQKNLFPEDAFSVCRGREGSCFFLIFFQFFFGSVFFSFFFSAPDNLS